MNRLTIALAVVALLVAGTAAPAAGLSLAEPAVSAQADDDPAVGANESAPGARFAATLDVHEAEVEGEMETRVFGIEVARAASDASKASVVGERVQTLRDRLTDLRERKLELAERRSAGDISQARYEAELAGIAARTAAIERQVNQTQAVSEELPRDVLDSRDVNASAIETLRRDARSLSGPEVAAIATMIAGPGVGGELGDREERGPPADRPGPDVPSPPGAPSGTDVDAPAGNGTVHSPSPTPLTYDPPRNGGAPSTPRNGTAVDSPNPGAPPTPGSAGRQVPGGDGLLDFSVGGGPPGGN